VNLPLTQVIDSQLVTHWNAGSTLTPSARNSLGRQATTAHFNLGASLIWLARPTLNLLLEALWRSEESVVGDGQAERGDYGVLSPGVRMAFNLPGGLQIVPGVAYTVGLGSDSSGDSLFLYLSFEHPFKRQ
jgi:hypothetical protein